MKKLIFLTVLLFGLVIQKINAQSSSGLNTYVSGYYLGWNGSSANPLNFATYDVSGSPVYQMTLTTNGDLNIVGGTNGYQIGLKQVLYTGGDPTSIFVGAQAPVSATYSLTVGRNVCLGYGVCPNLADGYSNTFAGAWAGNHIQNGHKDTYLGDSAGFSDTNGIYNIMIGYECGALTLGARSPATGYPNGDYNTMCGYECAFENVHGYANCYYGKAVGYWNNGYENCMYGGHAGNGTVSYAVDSNVFMGNYSAYEMFSGDQNVIIGTNAGLMTGSTSSYPSNYNVFIGGNGAPDNYGGTYDISLGFGANVNGFLTNAVAIGADAEVTNDNKLILGNNAQAVGIGMSGIIPGPSNKLEISRFSNSSGPEPCYTLAVTSTFTTTSCGGTTPTGASGLQFRDLTYESVPYANNPSSGFLTVDDLGNVVLMQSPAGNSGGFGDCNSPLNPPSGLMYDPAIDLQTNQHNFWFEGNSSSDLSTNVYIGYHCMDYPSVPLAKLNVLQASGSTSTICGYFENQDVGSSCFDPVIGIESLVDQPSSRSEYAQVAGWFQTEGTVSCCHTPQYAILVPERGGCVSIGVPAATTNYVPCAQPYLLSVFGSVWAMTGYFPSDSTLKINVTNISHNNNALSVIQKLNGVSFNYKDSVIRDSGMGGTHYGFIAQQVKRVLPNVIKTDNHGIEAVAYTEIIPWTVEALKQEKQTNDSLRYTLDSLRSAFQSIQTCLISLCGNNHSPVHHTGGNGNSGDSNTTITNVQDVMLSASVNAPLLYQNIPNPFSTGTKINYYLPEGTLGATMVFYDTYGNQIKVVQLSQTGNGTLNITPDNLNAGIYSYSLIVNNNIVDTKRMILQK